MSLIDWSDPDEMLGLLIEYVDDEAIAERRDSERAEFLRELSALVGRLGAQEFAGAEQMRLALREIREVQPREFSDDPVLTHLDACVEELERITSEG